MRLTGALRTLAAATAAATVLAAGVPSASAVIGGHKAAEGQFPFMLSLERKGPQGFVPSCGAVLIAPEVAVTAAHCVVVAGLLRVRSGSLNRTGGGTLTDVATVVDHPDYNSRTIDNDIAVLQLAGPIPGAVPAVLPAQGSDATGGAAAVIAGWGRTSPAGQPSASLMTADTSVVNRFECRKDYGASDISDQMGCTAVPAGGVGSCGGDEGGPVISDGKLIGLDSHSQGCAVKGWPSVHTRVGSFVSWIKAHEG